MAERRLYVGNLPNDTTECDLREFFKKYGVSAIELKQKPGLHDGVTFAYVNISAHKVNDCLEQCGTKNFKNTSIKIEEAKESFLEKLKKERDKKKEENSSTNHAFTESFINNGARINKKIIFTDDDTDNNQVQNDLLQNNMISFSPNRESEKRKLVPDLHNSDDEIPRKRNLPMFLGTASVSFANETSTPEFSMKRFEDFSDVWRDSSPENDLPKSKKLKWKINESMANLEESESSLKTTQPTKNSISKNVAESKRKNALQEKWKIIKEKKETIKRALKNLQSTPTKIKFTEPANKESEVEGKSGEKLVLFEDDISDDEFKPNFDVKEHLDGKNGLKLLNLKSKLSSDERFKLDDRFYEADETQPMENNASNRVSNEVDQQNKFFEQRSMMRYDPTKDDQVEKQLSSKITEKKKKGKKKSKLSKTIENNEQTETSKPEVSKKKHYSVTDSLKDAFKNTEEKTTFSLSAMFDTKIYKDKSSAENNNTEAVPVKKLKFIENPFANLSESEENDDVTIDEEPLSVLPDAVSSEKVLGKCGVWGETFFFQLNDSRLMEAVDFYKVPTKSKHTDFDKTRCKLKIIVRKKLQNSRRDKKLFKQKLGGRLNKAKFQKRLKKARS